VIGFAETYGRPVTEAAMAGLEVIPRKVVDYRGARFEEMDLEAILARRPDIALVDELAHTNIPGASRNEKRWQDVLDLLAADIDVITTVNIQHLESIGDTVERITGVRVRERVPDAVLRQADQIELVDSSPEQLRRRMLHGNIYPAEKVPQALSNFFREDNLAALRELTLRFLADETDDELIEHLRETPPGAVWETSERILVGVRAVPGSDAVIRRASRMAARLKADLHVLHVASGEARSDQDGATLAALRRLARDVGAEWTDVRADDPATALLAFAQERQITQIVLGPSRRTRWQELRSRGSIVNRMTRLAGEAGIDVHIIAWQEAPCREHSPAEQQ
jgi:two-component system sensor histidine kinase KdpD